MTMRRTDLALEARELWQESAGETTKLPGVEARDGEREGLPVTTVDILDHEGEKALGKPKGRYVTLTLEGLASREGDIFARSIQALAAELSLLLKDIPPQGLVLVAGLGNRAITPDAIGPKVHNYTLVTRHLVRQMPETFGAFRPVASLAAEVMGTTGVESGELIQSLCEKICPHCVIAVDALASRSLHRLCRTVQLTDTGITPGSGVGNHHRGSHGGGRRHPRCRSDGRGSTARSWGRPGPAGHPQGHRQSGGRPVQNHRLRHRSGPPARPDH